MHPWVVERQSAGLLVWLRVRAFALQVKDLGLVISNYKKKKKRRTRRKAEQKISEACLQCQSQHLKEKPG